MQTNTYYVAEFHKAGDPRPKFIGDESQLGLFNRIKSLGISVDSNDLFIVTVKDAIRESLLTSVDGCSICNNWDGAKCLCGKPIIHITPMCK